MRQAWGMALPHLSPAALEALGLEGRGPTVEELNEVSGIGEKLFAQISPKVSV